MLQGIATIFDNREEMLKRLKKKSYKEHTEQFMEKHGHYFQEMKAYVTEAEDKETACEEIGESLVQAVKEAFAGKKGKMNSRTQADLNFFMIYYVFPNVLALEETDGVQIAEGIRKVWAKNFQESNIQYTDYDTLNGSFREKIWGIF